ncbi:Hypothetical protein, putative, partial [Bodo saltans]
STGCRGYFNCEMNNNALSLFPVKVLVCTMSPTYFWPKWICDSVITMALLPVLLETLGSTVDAACTKYCNSGDTLSGSTCTTTVTASRSCPSGFSPSGGQCVDAGARCSGIISTMYGNKGECCYGTKMTPATTATGWSCFLSAGGPGGWSCGTSSGYGCYTSKRHTFIVSFRQADGSDCVSSFLYTCLSGYTLSGTTCTGTYAASTIESSTQCNIASPATDGCQWCSAISACLPDAASCPASCLVTPQTTCMNVPSACQWCSAIGVCQMDSIACFASCLVATANSSICDASTSCKYCTAGGTTSTTTKSIGVCQPNSGTCWATCTPASDDPLGAGVCTTSLDCKWCPTLGYCTERTRDCHTLCTTVAPDEPAICQVQSIQAQCQWCGAPGSVEYCVAVTDETRLRCAASCGGLIWRQDVCNGALECHWCGVHNAAQGGRCKPLPGKSRGYVAWRREVECDTESETSSVTLTVSQSLSLITTLTLTRHTETDEETLTRSFTQSSTVPNATVSLPITRQTHSISITQHHTKSMSISLSLSMSFSFSGTVSQSRSRTRSLTRSAGSATVSVTLTLSLTSASMSVSYHLPPCNASHLETLAYVWPQLFNFTTNYSAVRQVGFPSILLTGDVRDPGLIYRVPQLLRREVLYH